MKKTNKILGFIAMVSAILILPSALANNGVEFVEWEHILGPPGLYVDCLDEHVIRTAYFTARYHEFETPSGKFHVMDNWTATSMWTGLVSGRTWFGHGTSPLQYNFIGPGEVFQWNEKSVLKPVTGDGPIWKFKTSFKATINANGELVVFWEPPAEFSDITSCIGKPR